MINNIVDDTSFDIVANQAANPMAEQRRSTPVEELLAEGFGTLTNQPRSATQGRG